MSLSDLDITEAKLRTKYGYLPKKTMRWNERLKSKAKCSSSVCKRTVPIISWLPNYPFKKYIVGDVIAGLTTAIVRIPQGLAYGMLAGLMPINGLYTGFFSPLVYTIFGTSRHISVGVFSIVSLMLGSALEKYNDARSSVGKASTWMNPPTSDDIVTLYSNVTYETGNRTAQDFGNSSYTTTISSEDQISYEEQQNLLVICSLSVLIGLILVTLGLARLGIIAMFLSEPVVSSFTTAAAVYVVTAQMKYVTGIKLRGKSGVFGLIMTWVELLSRLSEINWPSIIVSAICLAVLIPIKYVNRTYKKELRNMPIPVELVVVILGTVISSYTNYGANNVHLIVGVVPRGMPAPILPDPSRWPQLIGDAVSIAIIIFAVAVSMGKIFAKKHGYSIDPNQELLALGLCQLTSAFFRGHSGGGALARSSVQESSGGNTQVAAMVSCCVLLLVLLLIGPLFETLPKACLACIILANLHGLLMQFQVLPGLFKVDKYDFSVWVVTCVAVLVCGIDIGLGIGVVFSLSCGGLRASSAKLSVVGEMTGSGEFGDVDVYKSAAEIPGIKVVRFSQSPIYANKNSLQQLTPEFVASTVIPQEKNSLLKEEYDGSGEAMSNNLFSEEDQCDTKFVVIDCSRWSVIDTVGLSTLKSALMDLSNAKMEIFLACLSDSIYRKLERYGIFDHADDKPLATAYHSISYAVNAARRKLSHNNGENFESSPV